MDERILGSLLNRRAAASGPGWGRPTGASRRRLPSSPRRPGLRVTIGRVPKRALLEVLAGRGRKQGVRLTRARGRQ